MSLTSGKCTNKHNFCDIFYRFASYKTPPPHVGAFPHAQYENYDRVNRRTLLQACTTPRRVRSICSARVWTKTMGILAGARHARRRLDIGHARPTHTHVAHLCCPPLSLRIAAKQMCERSCSHCHKIQICVYSFNQSMFVVCALVCSAILMMPATRTCARKQIVNRLLTRTRACSARSHHEVHVAQLWLCVIDRGPRYARYASSERAHAGRSLVARVDELNMQTCMCLCVYVCSACVRPQNCELCD